MKLFENDIEACLALQKSDMDALGYFYGLYHNRLFSFLTIYCRDQQLVEEMVQESFLKLWEKRDKVEGGKNIKHLLFTMAKNLVFDQLRRIKKEQESISRYLDTQTNIHDSLDDIIYADYKKLLATAIDAMPIRHREVFSLSRFRNLSNDEISNELRISIKTVEKHMTGSLKSIRSFLKTHDIYFKILLLLFVKL